MMPTTIIIYIIPLVLVYGFYLYNQKQRDKKSREIQKKQIESGRVEPIFLHPVIDPAKCVGCAACVAACPEKNAMGIINQKSVLISPLNCIGHGACKAACPFEAITLVFGTQKRGVDVPFIQPNFETNVSGIFIAGELGSMSAIRNSIEQGRLAMEAINERARKQKKAANVHDVVIIGSGPAGFSATLAALKYGLDYITLEQESLGGMVSHFPKDKIITTMPVLLPLIGKVDFNKYTTEKLLKFWQDAQACTGVKINYFERVDAVTRNEEYLKVTTQKNTYKTNAVLVAIGRRLTSRKLYVPGEEKAKVSYRFADPGQYRLKQVLVVGGGDSALEAALSVASVEGAKVTLSYRGEVFSCIKQKNLADLRAAQESGRISVILNSNVEEIKDSEVILEQSGKEIRLANDAVIVCGGGVLPIPFVKEMGIKVETKYGTS